MVAAYMKASTAARPHILHMTGKDDAVSFRVSIE